MSFDRDTLEPIHTWFTLNLTPSDGDKVPLYVREWCKQNCEHYGECGWIKKNCVYYTTPQWMKEKQVDEK